MRKAVGVLVLTMFALWEASAARAAIAAQPKAIAQAEVKLATTSRALDGLDAFIESVMKDWKVPGLSLAVIQNGQVIWLKGYGYRDLEKKTPVTPHTLFPIGSI